MITFNQSSAPGLKLPAIHGHPQSRGSQGKSILYTGLEHCSTGSKKSKRVTFGDYASTPSFGDPLSHLPSPSDYLKQTETEHEPQCNLIRPNTPPKLPIKNKYVLKVDYKSLSKSFTIPLPENARRSVPFLNRHNQVHFLVPFDETVEPKHKDPYKNEPSSFQKDKAKQRPKIGKRMAAMPIKKDVSKTKVKRPTDNSRVGKKMMTTPTKDGSNDLKSILPSTGRVDGTDNVTPSNKSTSPRGKIKLPTTRSTTGTQPTQSSYPRMGLGWSPGAMDIINDMTKLKLNQYEKRYHYKGKEATAEMPSSLANKEGRASKSKKQPPETEKDNGKFMRLPQGLKTSSARAKTKPPPIQKAVQKTPTENKKSSTIGKQRLPPRVGSSSESNSTSPPNALRSKPMSPVKTTTKDSISCTLKRSFSSTKRSNLKTVERGTIENKVQVGKSSPLSVAKLKKPTLEEINQITPSNRKLHSTTGVTADSTGKQIDDNKSLTSKVKNYMFYESREGVIETDVKTPITKPDPAPIKQDPKISFTINFLAARTAEKAAIKKVLQESDKTLNTWKSTMENVFN